MKTSKTAQAMTHETAVITLKQSFEFGFRVEYNQELGEDVLELTVPVALDAPPMLNLAYIEWLASKIGDRAARSLAEDMTDECYDLMTKEMFAQIIVKNRIR